MTSCLLPFRFLFAAFVSILRFVSQFRPPLVRRNHLLLILFLSQFLLWQPARFFWCCLFLIYTNNFDILPVIHLPRRLLYLLSILCHQLLRSTPYLSTLFFPWTTGRTSVAITYKIHNLQNCCTNFWTRSNQRYESPLVSSNSPVGM